MSRILCLIDSLGPGGAQRQLMGLGFFLKEQGYDVIVAAYHDNRFYDDQLLSKGAQYVYVRKAHKGILRQWHLMRFIAKVNPDVLISFLESPSIRACVAHIFNRKFKLIVSERNTSQHTGLTERVRFNLFRLADFVVPNAYAQSEYINTNFPFLSNKVYTIPNFVDLEHFVPPYNKTRRNVPEILIVATIWASKNTLGLLDAIAKLKEEGFRFHINWYGKVESKIDYFNQCVNKVRELGVGDCISFKEKTTQIRECYQDADYFCLPSFYEGTPNVICEAMACGLPVACSNVCDNSRYVAENENGFLFDPHNIESIAYALKRMLSLADDDYARYCLCSRKKAEQLLSRERFVKSYIELIEKI